MVKYGVMIIANGKDVNGYPNTSYRGNLPIVLNTVRYTHLGYARLNHRFVSIGYSALSAFKGKR